MISIQHGSIFDSKCDLLVIPCDSYGGVTHSVFSNLKEHNLPTNIGSIPSGGADFRSVQYEYASVVAYVASVEAETSTSDAEAITKIAKSIREYCRKNGILSVNTPLLGSGAGGLNILESFRRLREEFEADDQTTYTVFCFTEEAWKNISATYRAPVPPVIESPRVFISYAKNDDANADWVKELATSLRKNGVNSRLDEFHLKPGADLPQWMTDEIIKASKVLLVCDKHYMEKANFRAGGVGWETMLIQGDMLSQGNNKQKYIAIIREEKVESALPIFMRSKFALKWGKTDPSQQQLEELVLLLFDCDTEPEIGNIPDFVLRKKGLPE